MTERYAVCADLQKEESERPFRATRASLLRDLSGHLFLCLLVPFVPNQQNLSFSLVMNRGRCTAAKPRGLTWGKKHCWILGVAETGPLLILGDGFGGSTRIMCMPHRCKNTRGSTGMVGTVQSSAFFGVESVLQCRCLAHNILGLRLHAEKD
jgi:hypothetical protein